MKRIAPPLWLLVIVTACGTFGMHIFIPTLPELVRSFGIEPGSAQHAISVYLIGLALGQLVHGPASDTLGRRRVLSAALALYVVAGIVAALATGYTMLLGARLVQAFGGCAGLVLGRAMIRDTADGPNTASRLALLNTVLVMSPGFAPLVGGLIAEATGWRGVAWALCALGAATLFAVWWRLPETTPATRRNVSQVAVGYGRLLASPKFVALTVAGSCTTTSMYAFMTASPFIFQHELGRSAHELGLYYIILIAGVGVGSIAASRLALKANLGRMLQAANLIAVVASFTFLIAVATGNLSVVSAIAPMFCFMIAVGIASPMALSMAVSIDPAAAGSAAGLYGAAQMACGALCTTAAGLGASPALAAAITMAFAALVGMGAAASALRKAKISA